MTCTFWKVMPQILSNKIFKLNTFCTWLLSLLLQRHHKRKYWLFLSFPSCCFSLLCLAIGLKQLQFLLLYMLIGPAFKITYSVTHTEFNMCLTPKYCINPISQNCYCFRRERNILKHEHIVRTFFFLNCCSAACREGCWAMSSWDPSVRDCAKKEMLIRQIMCTAIRWA